MKKFLSFMFMVMSVTALFAQNVMKPNEVVFGHHAKNAMKVKKVASDEFLTTAPEGKSASIIALDAHFMIIVIRQFLHALMVRLHV